MHAPVFNDLHILRAAPVSDMRCGRIYVRLGKVCCAFSTAHLSSSLQMHRLHASGVCVLRSPSTHLHFSASDMTATGVLRPKDLENGFCSQGRWVSDGDKTVKEAEDGDERSKGRKKNGALNLSSPQAFSYTEQRAAFSLIELASAELSYRKYSRVHGGIPALARVLQNPNDLWDNKE